MCEYNITAESKETIKDLIKDYNLLILQDSLKKYKSDEKPTIEELTETLSNHVFLDRKNDGNIGFINDFVFGFLVGENLLTGKFKEHYKSEFTKVIPQDFAQKSIDAFKIQDENKKYKLWEVFNESSFNYSTDFYFDSEYFLRKQLNRNYQNLFLTDRTIRNFNFDNAIINNTVFSGVIFEDCKFDTSKFIQTSFQNCKFFSCVVIGDNNISYDDFAIYACIDNNDFIEKINSYYSKDSEEVSINNILTEELVLQQFLQVDSKRPKPRKFSYIKKRLSNYSDKEISRIIDVLKRKEFLHFKDDVGFITREAMNFLNHTNN